MLKIYKDPELQHEVRHGNKQNTLLLMLNTLASDADYSIQLWLGNDDKNKQYTDIKVLAADLNNNYENINIIKIRDGEIKPDWNNVSPQNGTNFVQLSSVNNGIVTDDPDTAQTFWLNVKLLKNEDKVHINNLILKILRKENGIDQSHNLFYCGTAYCGTTYCGGWINNINPLYLDIFGNDYIPNSPEINKSTGFNKPKVVSAL